MLGKTSCYSIDVSGNDRHILLFYKKFHFCHLLPFAKVGHNCTCMEVAFFTKMNTYSTIFNVQLFVVAYVDLHGCTNNINN